MSASDIFRSAVQFFQQPSAGQQSQGAQPAQQSNQPGTLPTGQISQLEQQGQGAQTGQINQSGVIQSGPGAESSAVQPPFADFKDIWKDINTQQGTRPAINADRTKIDAVAKGIDFTKGINPTLVQKALAGDQAAFLQVLNESAQQGFAVAMQASSHLVDKQSGAVIDHMQTALPNQLKTFQSRESFLGANPKFNDPAVQPLLSVIQTQLVNQFPTATAAEIAQHAQKYLMSVAGALATPDKGNEVVETGSQQDTFAYRQQQKKQAADKFNWGEWAVPEQQG